MRNACKILYELVQFSTWRGSQAEGYGRFVWAKSPASESSGHPGYLGKTYGSHRRYKVNPDLWYVYESLKDTRNDLGGRREGKAAREIAQLVMFRHMIGRFCILKNKVKGPSWHLSQPYIPHHPRRSARALDQKTLTRNIHKHL